MRFSREEIAEAIVGLDHQTSTTRAHYASVRTACPGTGFRAPTALRGIEPTVRRRDAVSLGRMSTPRPVLPTRNGRAPADQASSVAGQSRPSAPNTAAWSAKLSLGSLTFWPVSSSTEHGPAVRDGPDRQVQVSGRSLPYCRWWRSTRAGCRSSASAAARLEQRREQGVDQVGDRRPVVDQNAVDQQVTSIDDRCGQRQALRQVQCVERLPVRRHDARSGGARAPDSDLPGAVQARRCN